MGLGNPGPDYQSTRHNAGYWFVEKWAGTRALSLRKAWFRPFLFARVRQGTDTLVLVKTLTYMNLSGQVVPQILAHFNIEPEQLLVVFDQMDLPPGRSRLKPHGSHGGHNGLRSIETVMATDRYHRLAIGVGRPAVGTSVVEHVLGTATAQELVRIERCLARCIEVADSVWHLGWEPLINGINQRDEERT